MAHRPFDGPSSKYKEEVNSSVPTNNLDDPTVYLARMHGSSSPSTDSRSIHMRKHSLDVRSCVDNLRLKRSVVAPLTLQISDDFSRVDCSWPLQGHFSSHE